MEANSVSQSSPSSSSSLSSSDNSNIGPGTAAGWLDGMRPKSLALVVVTNVRPLLAGETLAAEEAPNIGPLLVVETLAAEEAPNLKPAVPAGEVPNWKPAVPAGEALNWKPVVPAGEVQKIVGMTAGSLMPPKPMSSSLIESDFSSTPLESFITHPVNVFLFSVEYLSTGMDVFSIHLSSVES